MKNLYSVIWVFEFIIATSFFAPKKLLPPAPISSGANGQLVYVPDSLGNRIPDFSYCGYMAGELPIPNVPIRIIVPVKEGDATLRIQSAINYVASLPADQNGIRGAVLLEKGKYIVSGSIKINASGIVLRGSGMDKNGTFLIGSGPDRQTLICIKGKNDIKAEPETIIEDIFLPVNAIKFHITSNSVKAGDMILIHRPSTSEWIQKLGTDHFGGGITALGWKPGDYDLYWDRKVLSVDGNTVTLDAPLTTALDTTFGGAYIAKYNWPGRISQVGVENLYCQSTCDPGNPKDEDHRWMAITIENTQDAWVRQIIFGHFAGSAVAIWETAKRITVEDCKSLSPVSEIGGQRRNTFLTAGQQTLFQRLYAEHGYHDFSTGYCAAGPNAFVQCESHQPYSFSGGINSWSSGVLFDLIYVDGNAIKFTNLGQDLQGAGWNTTNSVLWNCSASRVDCYKPPTANNWSFGTWAEFSGDGYWGNSNNSIQPRSLYYAQLSDRLGKDISDRIQLLHVETEASSSPTIEQATTLTAQSIKPFLQLSEFIDSASLRNPIPIVTMGITTIDLIGIEKPVTIKQAPLLQIKNGWLMRGDYIVTGTRIDVPWWKGTLRPSYIKNSEPAITRFVPGRTGTGYTDDLDEVTGWMTSKNIVALEQNYALWYERRRDDHERIRRMDGDVWPPFYELPFARSGLDTAWNGLSKYDLTKYNAWYWLRLKQFADLADQKGLILIHQNYFQHNIIEAGAHWADCPWRSANNINNTGFPEPPPYAGDKRIFMAEQFYDITHPVRNQLHQAYIRQCLDNFKENNSVIQFISAEFTGPFHFTKFWLQTIADWEKKTGVQENIGLSVTKDVQDSILSDPNLASAIDLIDIRYWSYRNDGSVYAPKGGMNLAPRQFARIMKPGKRSFEQTYRAVHEYRQKFPEKAVMYSEGGWDIYGWAIFMAGGSLATIPKIDNNEFLIDAATMKPVSLPENHVKQWALANSDNEYIIYNASGEPVTLDLSKEKNTFVVRYINPETGSIIGQEEKINGGSIIKISNKNSDLVITWISKIK